MRQVFVPVGRFSNLFKRPDATGKKLSFFAGSIGVCSHMRGSHNLCRGTADIGLLRRGQERLIIRSQIGRIPLSLVS